MHHEAALDFRSTNALWASVLVETLVRAGVRRAVVSPGSRSTPLTIALARHPRIQAYPVLDERSAAFFALGLAKVDLKPVVLVCTSGTAAANYFPAIIEAHESAVPLLVLTADRPPELRACASGQTIDQLKLYGSYVGFFHELAVPALDLELLRYLRQTTSHAVVRTLQPQRGPVHLNAPFRDPLPPLPDGGAADRFAAAIDWADFFAQVETPVPVSRASVGPALQPDIHGVIVVGPTQPADVGAFVTALKTLANRLGWPVLADALSPVRQHASRFPSLVTTYDTLLRDAGTAEQLKPECVVAVGGWPTSKVLRGWLQAADARTWLVPERCDNRDALHGRTQAIAADLAVFAGQQPAVDGWGGYARLWMWAEKATRSLLDEQLQRMPELVEPKVAWLLAQCLPPGTPLFIANSMPIRDLEYFWPGNDRGVRPFCNRGANGIDGTLSSALGIAEAAGRPTVLLTGDLSLLHDTNGFLLSGRVRASLTIVLINNHGGGIFEHLPIAGFEPPFEEYFATPQTVDFATLCRAYGVTHEIVGREADLATRLATLPPTGLRLLEVQTDRKKDAALRKQWFADAAKAAAPRG